MSLNKKTKPRLAKPSPPPIWGDVEIVMLREQGMTYTDMAKKFGVSVESVKSRLGRALLKSIEHKDEFNRLKEIGPYISLESHRDEVANLRNRHEGMIKHYREVYSAKTVKIAALETKLRDIIYFANLAGIEHKVKRGKELMLRLTGYGDEHDCVSFLVKKLHLKDEIASDYYQKMSTNGAIRHRFDEEKIVRGSIYVCITDT
jgi:hypothetical protein